MSAPQERSILHELESFAEAVAKKAAAHADDVEVLVTRRDLVSFAIENRTLAPELKLGRLSVGLRALKNGRLAVAATTSPSVDENVAALKAALSAARPVKLESFAAHRLEPSTRAFDESVARLLREPRALQALAVDVRDRAFEAAKDRPHVDSIEGRVSAQTRWTAMATTRGRASALEALATVGVEANAARYEFEALRAWPADDAFVRDVGARAVRSFPKEVVAPSDLGLAPASEVAALVDANLVEALLRFPAHDRFLASSLAAGLAPHQPGDVVADRRIHLVDTGRPAELARDFDDELVPRGETVLVDHGRFGSFVTSRASARATGLPETGNGVRHPLLAEEPSEAPVRDKLLGLAMDPGTRTFDELSREAEIVIVPRALLGIHGADRARAAFSATVADGVALRNGVVVGQLAPGRWNLSGRVLPGDGERGLFEVAEPTKERVFTGSALLPHVLARLVVS